MSDYEFSQILKSSLKYDYSCSENSVCLGKEEAFIVASIAFYREISHGFGADFYTQGILKLNRPYYVCMTSEKNTAIKYRYSSKSVFVDFIPKIGIGFNDAGLKGPVTCAITDSQDEFNKMNEDEEVGVSYRNIYSEIKFNPCYFLYQNKIGKNHLNYQLILKHSEPIFRSLCYNYLKEENSIEEKCCDEFFLLFNGTPNASFTGVNQQKFVEEGNAIFHFPTNAIVFFSEENLEKFDTGYYHQFP